MVRPDRREPPEPPPGGAIFGGRGAAGALAVVGVAGAWKAGDDGESTRETEGGVAVSEEIAEVMAEAASRALAESATEEAAAIIGFGYGAVFSGPSTLSLSLVAAGTALEGMGVGLSVTRA